MIWNDQIKKNRLLSDLLRRSRPAPTWQQRRTPSGSRHQTPPPEETRTESNQQQAVKYKPNIAETFHKHPEVLSVCGAAATFGPLMDTSQFNSLVTLMGTDTFMSLWKSLPTERMQPSLFWSRANQDLASLMGWGSTKMYALAPANDFITKAVSLEDTHTHTHGCFSIPVRAMDGNFIAKPWPFTLKLT